MGNPDIQDLNSRAASLRSLADHIDSLLDPPHTQSTKVMKTWSGPNADDVRGKLKGWRTKCTTVAKALRDEAHKASQEAKDLQNPKK